MKKQTMNHSFYQQLQEKIPQWKAHGWLDEKSANAILKDALLDAHKRDDSVGSTHTASKGKSHKLSLIISVMGVLLLSAGAISFLAANWQGMSKLIKLILLFSSMASAYLAAAWALSPHKSLYHQSKQRYPALGQSFLLLGVLFFGNNIMLVAQIYHIDSHYPNGILLWAAGAFITTIIIRSEVVLIAASLLALLWTGMETFDFRLIHWPWLIFFAASVFTVIRQRYHLATHIIVITLFLWLLFNYENFNLYVSDGVIIQTYLLLGITLFLFAHTVYHNNYFLKILARYGFVFSLFFLYLLSFPDLGLYSVGKKQSIGTIINLALIAGVVIIAFVYYKQHKQSMPFYKWSGLLWLLILVITLSMSLLSNAEVQNVSIIIINLLLFLLVIGLVYSGLSEHNIFYVNIAFIVFIITFLSRYFDTFWSLMDRSLFFSIGGLLLIVGGYWLEQKRRQLNHVFLTQSHKSHDSEYEEVR